MTCGTGAVPAIGASLLQPGTVHEEVSMSVRGIRRLLAVGVSTTLLLTVVGVAPVAACDQGCTPGYWKNHTESWVGYNPNQTLAQAGFIIPSPLASFGTVKLIDALQGGGGPGLDGAAKILFRAAAASLLNGAALAGPPDYHFWTPLEILNGQGTRFTGVNQILAMTPLTRQVMLDYAAELDYINNLGCPLN
jgi:hypothetical protein